MQHFTHYGVWVISGMNHRLVAVVFLWLAILQIEQQLEGLMLELFEHDLLLWIPARPVAIGLANELMENLQGLFAKEDRDLVVFF